MKGKFKTEQMKEALLNFCNKEEVYWKMKNPFLRDQELYATDGRFMLNIHKNLGLDLNQFEPGKLKAEVVTHCMKVTDILSVEALEKGLEGAKEKNLVLIGTTKISQSVALHILNALKMLGCEYAYYGDGEGKASVISIVDIRDYDEIEVAKILFMPNISEDEPDVAIPVIPMGTGYELIKEIDAKAGMKFIHDWKIAEEKRKEELKNTRVVYLVPFIRKAYVPVLANSEKEARKLANKYGDPDYWDDEDEWFLDDSEVTDLQDVEDAKEDYDLVVTSEGYKDWDEALK